MITGEQIRTARELLGLAPGTVSRMAHMSRASYQAAEAGELQLNARCVGRLKATLERAGVEFAADSCEVSLKPKEAVDITAGQIKAARKLLGWSGARLATKSSRSAKTVADAESCNLNPRFAEASLRAIRSALEQAGVEFIPENGGGAGVRLRKTPSHD